MTTASPAGAGPFRITYKAAEMPALVLALGDQSWLSSGSAARVLANVTDPDEAVITTGTDCLTAAVCIGNLAEYFPAGMVTVEGTPTVDGEALDSENTEPPEGAGEETMSVPVELTPPTNSAGDSRKPSLTGGGLKGARPPANGR